MSAPTTVYVAPTNQGSGDGLSAANARGLNAAGLAWLQAMRQTWRTELDASPTDVGINEAFTFRSVTPGFEPDYGDKSHVTAVKYGVFVRRVCWLTDKGDYTVVASAKGNPWVDFDSSMGPAAPTDLTVGASSGSPVRFFDNLAYRSSDGATAATVSGSTVTRSQSIPHKGPSATWTDPVNYTSGLWTGATTTVTHTWTVNLPSPVRAVLRGNRTADPRTDKTTQQWCTAAQARPATFEINDPTSSAVEPRILDGTGGRVTIMQGQVWDSVAGAVVDHPWTNDGAYALHDQASCIAYRGFEGQSLYALFSHAGSALTKFQVFRDIRVNNARYVQWRGDNKYDVEFSRVQTTSVAQKHFGPGQNCQRWNFKDLYINGEFCVGDQFPATIGAANGSTGTENAYNAGAFRFEDVIAENIWNAGPAGGSYVNGDGLESELRGWSIRNYWADLTPDGGIDTKPTPYWSNWPAVSVFNVRLSRNKRAFRSWPSVQNTNAVAPHILRDVTLADARQYGLFMVGMPGHHKFVDWYNPDGRANWTNPLGRTFVAVSNDGSIGGDMDAVIHQAFDGRTGSKPFTLGMNSLTVRGVTIKPFRARVWTPVTTPTDLVVAVNGSTTDDGSSLSVLSGTSITLAPSGLPTGSTATYTLSGPGTVTPSGVNATVVPTT